jgi:uncharacterized protein YecE (DUF72 family)
VADHGQVRVGVSGWRYKGWRGDFYPTGLVQRRELEYIASRMSSAEVNGSFYSLLRPSTYAGFRTQTPDGFVLAVKGGRYITHIRRLAGAETALANFLASGVLALGPKLGPLLWQLPPTLAYDEERLLSFFALLPRTTAEAAALAARHDDKLAADRVHLEVEADRPLRHAFEVRHPSFCTDRTVGLLREHGIALVLADSPHKWPLLEKDTADFRYVRLHGHPDLYASGYSSATLDYWADKVREWTAAGQDSYVYFDNDIRGRAPYDAVGLLDRLSDGQKA